MRWIRDLGQKNLKGMKREYKTLTVIHRCVAKSKRPKKCHADALAVILN